MRITVLLGGSSMERDVSLASGLRIANALRSRGHRVKAIDTATGPLDPSQEHALLQEPVVKPVPPARAELARLGEDGLARLAGFLPGRDETDVVFLALHGGTGEDGTIQAVLELAGLRYTGSGHVASGLAMDKDLSKRLFVTAGVRTPNWVMAPAEPIAVVRQVGLPAIVKPSKQGSTVGLALVKDEKDLPSAVDDAFRYDDEVLIEQYIPGREFTVGILGGETLPVGEIIPTHEIYDYECKYTQGMVEEIFPADLPSEITHAIQQQALTAFNALKLRGYGRVDFRLSDAGTLYCLEANTLPGMTETSLVPQAAAAAGISFPELCERIAILSLDGRM